MNHFLAKFKHWIESDRVSKTPKCKGVSSSSGGEWCSENIKAILHRTARLPATFAGLLNAPVHNALVHLSHRRGLSTEQPASAHPLSLPRSASQKLALRRIFSIKKNCRLAFPLTPPNEPFSGSQLMKNMPSVCCKAHLKPVEDLRLCFALESQSQRDQREGKCWCRLQTSLLQWRLLLRRRNTIRVLLPQSVKLMFSFLSSVIKTCSPECCNRVLFSRLLWAPLSFYGSLGPWHPPTLWSCTQFKADSMISKWTTLNWFKYQISTGLFSNKIYFFMAQCSRL